MSINYFSVCQGTDSGDDFFVRNAFVFINDFLFCCTLCVLKISASAVELGSGDDFWVGSDVVFSMIYDSALLFVH